MYKLKTAKEIRNGAHIIMNKSDIDNRFIVIELDKNNDALLNDIIDRYFTDNTYNLIKMLNNDDIKKIRYLIKQTLIKEPRSFMDSLWLSRVQSYHNNLDFDRIASNVLSALIVLVKDDKDLKKKLNEISNKK